MSVRWKTDSDQLFKDATVYLSEIENRYITGEKRRKVIHGLYKLFLFRVTHGVIWFI